MECFAFLLFLKIRQFKGMDFYNSWVHAAFLRADWMKYGISSKRDLSRVFYDTKQNEKAYWCCMQISTLFLCQCFPRTHRLQKSYQFLDYAWLYWMNRTMKHSPPDPILTAYKCSSIFFLFVLWHFINRQHEQQSPWMQSSFSHLFI